MRLATGEMGLGRLWRPRHRRSGAIAIVAALLITWIGFPVGSVLGTTEAWAESVPSQCRDDRVELRGDWGVGRFRVELAQTDEDRALGLMNRDSMPAGAGMLFIYPAPQQRIAFWMRNTRIPLDIIFLDASGTVRRIAHQAVPFDETPLPGGPDIQYVLEINGGMAKSMGIGPGTVLRHSQILPDLAAWPC